MKIIRSSVTVAMAVCLAVGVNADDHEADGASKVLEEIVVTANKREQSLMEVAQSIQYLGGAELEAAGVRNLNDIVKLAPGVTQPSGSAETSYYNIRGTGAVTLADSPVGFYIDGMPHYIVDLPYGPDLEVFDLESIQILRGPQGTLYGQGAQGGTILVTTAKPDLDEFRARVRAGASRMEDGGNGHTYDASISVPLIEGKLAASLTAGGSRDPGLGEIPGVSGSDLDEYNRWYARLKVLWQPSDELRITGLVQHRELEADQSRTSYISVNPPLLSGGDGAGTDVELDLFGLNIEWDTGFATLTSATTYMAYEYSLTSTFAFQDPNFGDILFDIDFDRNNVKTFNQELRLTSTGEGDWDWIGGLSYTRGESPSETTNTTVSPPVLASTITDVGVTESTQIAVFGEVSRSFMDGLITPLLGLRYFHDDRDTDGVSTLEQAGFDVPLGGFNEDEVFDLVSPRFNLRITPSDEMMFYLNISRGFRSGTFNSPATVATAAQFGITVDVAVPESTVWSYEAGARFLLLDGDLLIEPTLYLADYEDYQVTGTVGSTVVRAGIDEVEATGAELLVRWNTSVEGLSLSMVGSANSTKAEAIDPALDETLAGINDGEQLPYVPEWDLRLGVDYEWAVMGDWTAYVSASYFRRDGQGDFIFPLTTGIVSDLGLRLALANQNWRATLWGENLTDDEGPAALSGGLLTRWDRRSVGVTLEYTFD